MKQHYRDSRRGRSSYGTQGASQSSQGGRQSQNHASTGPQSNTTNYGNNYNIHQQQVSGTYGGQEQSVERLKSCIADLKKLATSKVKKTSSGMQNSNSNLHSQSNLYEQNNQYDKYDPSRYHGGANVAQQVPYTHANPGNSAMGYGPNSQMRGNSQSSAQMKQPSSGLQETAFSHPGQQHGGSVSYSNMRSGSQSHYQGYPKQQTQNLTKKSSKENLHIPRDQQRGRPSDRYNQGANQKSGYTQSHYQQQKTHQYAQMQMQSSQDHRQGKGQNNKIQNALKKYMNDIGESHVVSPPNASTINFQKYGHMQKADNRSTNYSQAFTESGGHNQVRSATTKKPRPQSGKPTQTEKHGQHGIQTHVVGQQQNPRGGSLKRELYNSNQNQLSLQGSSHKYGQKSSKAGVANGSQTGSVQPMQSAQFTQGSGFNSVQGQGPQKQNSMSKMKPHQISQNPNSNVKQDAARGGHSGLQPAAPQRKAQSVDPRDRAAAAFVHNGTPGGNSRNPGSHQATAPNNVQSFGPSNAAGYRPDQKSSTQNFGHRQDARPHSGYIATNVQPRSNSTSYLQKQSHFHHSNASYNQYDQNGHRTSQARGSSAHDLSKSTKTAAYPTGSTKDMSQSVANKYQHEFQKFQNYQKVLSDRPAINDSNYRPSSSNHRQNGNTSATQGFNPTASTAKVKSVHNDTRMSQRASQETQKYSQSYDSQSNVANERARAAHQPTSSKSQAKYPTQPQGQEMVTSPNFRQQTKPYPKQGSSQKQEIMREFANDPAQFKTQQQQMLESYNRSKAKNANRAQHSQRDKQQLSQRGSVLSKRESTQPMGPEVRREAPLMPNQSQTGTYSQSHSQMSMMGANVSNDFKDGQTNIVQNLQVNLSPTSQNATKSSFKNHSQNEAQGAVNYSITNYKSNNHTSSSLAAQDKQKSSQSFDIGQQQPPQMGGGRAPIHTQHMNNSQFQNSKGSLPKGANAQYMQPNTIYSLQQANVGNYNSLSLNNGGQYLSGVTGPGGNHTLNYLHSNARTLIVTKEDFNIEDIHVQMVFKIQREKQILLEIEGDPSGKVMDTSDLTTHQVDENVKEPQLIELLDQDEILGNDMCKEPAINWGRGKPPLQPVVLAMQQSNIQQPRSHQIQYVDNPNRFSNQHPQKGPGPAPHIPSVNNFVGNYASGKIPKNLSQQEQQSLLQQHQQHFEKLQQQYMQQLKQYW